MSETLVVVLTLLVMLVGLVGVVVPVLPGVVLIGLAGIGSTFVLGTGSGGWALIVVLAVLTAGGAVASIVLPARRGLRGDAARSSLLLALAGGVVGFVVIPVVGLPVGAIGALFAAEAARTGDRDRAWTTTRGVLRAYGVGLLVELAAGLLLVAIWLTATIVRL